MASLIIAFVVSDLNQDGALDVIGVSTDGTDNSSRLFSFLALTEEVSAVRDVDVSTPESAQNLLQILDDGLARLASARSQLMDADIAAESAELSEQQILQQAGVATLTQANAQLRTVLQLLRA